MIITDNVKKYLAACAIVMTATTAQAQFVLFGDTISQQQLEDDYLEARKAIQDVNFTMDDYREQLTDEFVLARYARENNLLKQYPKLEQSCQRFEQKLYADSLYSRQIDLDFYMALKKRLLREVEVEQIYVVVHPMAPAADTLAAYNKALKAREMALKKVPFAQIKKELGLQEELETKLDYFVPGKRDKQYDDLAFGTDVGEISPIVRSFAGYYFLKVTGRRYQQGFYTLRQVGSSPKSGKLPLMNSTEAVRAFGSGIIEKKQGDVVAAISGPYAGKMYNIENFSMQKSEIDLQTEARNIMASVPGYNTEVSYQTALQLAKRYGFRWNGSYAEAKSRLHEAFRSAKSESELLKKLNKAPLIYIEGKAHKVSGMLRTVVMKWSESDVADENMKQILTDYVIGYHRQKILSRPDISAKLKKYRRQQLMTAAAQEILKVEPTPEEQAKGSQWMVDRVRRKINELKTLYKVK